VWSYPESPCSFHGTGTGAPETSQGGTYHYHLGGLVLALAIPYGESVSTIRKTQSKTEQSL
jgi:hypothetical protein